MHAHVNLVKVNEKELTDQTKQRDIFKEAMAHPYLFCSTAFPLSKARTKSKGPGYKSAAATLRESWYHIARSI